MRISCPRCLRSLSTADPGGPPAFCMYCGQKLRDTDAPPPSNDETTALVPFSADPDEDADPTPDIIGGYRLVRKLGSGGMGTVYEAEAPDTGGRVAVKLLSAKLAANPGSVERFRQEGRLASQLSHPRCVFVLAADTDGGRPYIVMELMPGKTLKDLVDERGPLPPDEAVGHILDVIDGLTEAHRLGVLHRDVKPSNCFLTADGRVKVGDFGLSKSLAAADRRQLTQSGAFLGTVLFASPEQLRSEPLDYASDVYSVCATLYYLLGGVPPYHHESVTAALLKTAEGPPESLRAKRPAVSRALEKVVMKGLEQARERRWATLDELRDALVALRPAEQVPARPRLLVGAYVIDTLVVVLAVEFPVEVAKGLLGVDGRPAVGFNGGRVDPVAWLLYTAYFALSEGLTGATAGKWLLGLRVSRVGRTGPPGVAAAAARAGVFSLLWIAVLYGPLVDPAGLAVSAAGVAALAVQLRRTAGGYRGPHDFASGCHVTRRPRPPRKLRLRVTRPAALDRPDPAGVPEALGGFAVGGRVAGDPGGEQVWAAEDRALGRRVLIRLTPGREPADGEAAELSRPARLRRLGGGRLGWAGREWGWAAFAAPVGCPLADAVDPARPLPWADARLLLDQVADELRAAEADGTLPDRLTLDQVWVEPTGRVQVLDFPLTREQTPPPNPLPDAGTGNRNRRPGSSSPSPPRGGGRGEGSASVPLLRQVASLALEGRPRQTADSIRAPLPPHAGPILGKLFAAGGYGAVADLCRDLRETHAHPAEVTPGIRAAQLGIQAVLVGGGLLVMFVAAALAGVFATLAAAEGASRAEAARGAVAALGSREGVAAARLAELRDARLAEADARRAALPAPLRLAYEEVEVSDDSEAERAAVGLLVGWATDRAADPKAPPEPMTPRRVGLGAAGVVAAVPLALAAVAVVFRGGASMLLAGVAVVRADGRRAARWRCGVRAAAVWVPVGGLLCGAVWVQVEAYRLWQLAAGLWLAALALLPVYLAVALKYPARSPQDRLVGTYLVPE